MEFYAAYAIAETRSAEFTREAATERLGRLVRRERTRKPAKESRPAPSVRPVTA